MMIRPLKLHKILTGSPALGWKYCKSAGTDSKRFVLLLSVTSQILTCNEPNMRMSRSPLPEHQRCISACHPLPTVRFQVLPCSLSSLQGQQHNPAVTHLHPHQLMLPEVLCCTQLMDHLRVPSVTSSEC